MKAREIGGGGRYYSRDERRGQIAYHIARAYEGGEGGHTMYSIARILLMQPSSHLTKMLNGMVAQKLLAYKDVRHTSRVNKRLYFPARQLYCDTITSEKALLGAEVGKSHLEEAERGTEEGDQQRMF